MKLLILLARSLFLPNVSYKACNWFYCDAYNYLRRENSETDQVLKKSSDVYK